MKKFYKIKDFTEYKISKCGKVINKHGKILKLNISKRNYYYKVRLFKNNKCYTKTIHRLVAINFIKNKYNKYCVNHINGNKLNNNVNNLEWVTNSENSKHLYQVLNYKSHLIKNVLQYDLNNNLIKIWEGFREVERNLNIKQSSISKCCKGIYKTAGGFIWRFEKLKL